MGIFKLQKQYYVLSRLIKEELLVKERSTIKSIKNVEL